MQINKIQKLRISSLNKFFIKPRSIKHYNAIRQPI